MAFKKAENVRRIGKDGFEKLFDSGIEAVTFSMKTQEISVVMRNNPAGDAYIDGMEGEPVSGSEPIDMTNVEDATILVTVSDALWPKLVKMKMYPTFETDDDGNPVIVMKSLEDLNATIVDVPLPVPDEQ